MKYLTIALLLSVSSSVHAGCRFFLTNNTLMSNLAKFPETAMGCQSVQVELQSGQRLGSTSQRTMQDQVIVFGCQSLDYTGPQSFVEADIAKVYDLHGNQIWP